MGKRFGQKIAPNLTEERDTTAAGRGLFATKDIEDRGQILGIQRPLVIALDTARLNDHCYNCLGYTSEVDKSVPAAPEQQETSELSSCQFCKKVKYCSEVSPKSFMFDSKQSFSNHNSEDSVVARIAGTLCISMNARLSRRCLNRSQMLVPPYFSCCF